jgi:hypothetical protein
MEPPNKDHRFKAIKDLGTGEEDDDTVKELAQETEYFTAANLGEAIEKTYIETTQGDRSFVDIFREKTKQIREKYYCSMTSAS